MTGSSDFLISVTVSMILALPILLVTAIISGRRLVMALQTKGEARVAYLRSARNEGLAGGAIALGIVFYTAL